MYGSFECSDAPEVVAVRMTKPAREEKRGGSTQKAPTRTCIQRKKTTKTNQINILQNDNMKNKKRKKNGKSKTRENHVKHKPNGGKTKNEQRTAAEKKRRGEVTLMLMPLKQRPQKERRGRGEKKNRIEAQNTQSQNERNFREKRKRGTHTQTPASKASFKLKPGLTPNKTSKNSTRAQKQNRKVWPLTNKVFSPFLCLLNTAKGYNRQNIHTHATAKKAEQPPRKVWGWK